MLCRERDTIALMNNTLLKPEDRQLLISYLEKCIKLIIQGKIKLASTGIDFSNQIETIRNAILLEEQLKQKQADLKSPDNKGIISFINDYLLFVIEADNITDLGWISKLLMIRERFVENRQ